jgi:nucleotide-binding universal stress UspA family protein
MRPVVVGSSGRPDERALDLALAEAARRRLPLLVVRAFHAPALDASAREARPEQVRQQVEAAFTRVPAARRASVTVVVREGEASACLLSAADSAALLVVGHHPAGPVPRAVHGSVAATCLRRACCPLVVVPDGLATEADPGLQRRVLVGLDGSAGSLAALTWAVVQAREWGCPLVPVVVLSPAAQPPVGFRGAVADVMGEVAEQVADAGGADVETRPRLLQGHHVRQLLELVQPADLLVLGHQRPGAVSSLLDGGGTSIALRSPCPVVVVREGQARREIHQRRVQPQPS